MTEGGKQQRILHYSKRKIVVLPSLMENVCVCVCVCVCINKEVEE